MMSWMKTGPARFIVVLAAVVLVAIVAVIGAGGAANAQTQSNTTARNAQTQSNTSATGEDRKIVGTITSVNMTGQTFALLPDGTHESVTIVFNAKTNIEGGQATLKTGAHVSVEVLQQTDGSLSATEVKPSPAGNGNNGNVDDHGGADDHGHDGGADDHGDDN